jgi:hypothetical protein
MATSARVENFWGTDFPEVGESTPVVLLRQQAELLGELTDGKVSGVVKKADLGGTTYASMYLAVPAMGDYQFKLLSLAHPVVANPADPFPITVETSLPDGSKKEISSMREFEEWLKEFLSSEPVHIAIGAMKARGER